MPGESKPKAICSPGGAIDDFLQCGGRPAFTAHGNPSQLEARAWGVFVGCGFVLLPWLGGLARAAFDLVLDSDVALRPLAHHRSL